MRDGINVIIANTQKVACCLSIGRFTVDLDHGPIQNPAPVVPLEISKLYPVQQRALINACFILNTWELGSHALKKHFHTVQFLQELTTHRVPNINYSLFSSINTRSLQHLYFVS